MDHEAPKLKIILITIINFFVRSFRRTVDQGALKIKIIIINKLFMFFQEDCGSGGSQNQNNNNNNNNNNK